MNGILNKLVDRRIGSFGDPSDYVNKTEYTLKFWKDTLTSSLISSYIKNNTLFGELNHPKAEYRTREIDLAKVSHRVNNIRFIDNSGKMIARINEDGVWENLSDYSDKVVGEIIADVDILDTPLGNILNTYYLSKSNIGFSTRADGDHERGKNGVRVITSYYMIAIDAVLYPSKQNSRIVDESGEVDLNLKECYNRIRSLDESSLRSIEDYIVATPNIENNYVLNGIFREFFADDLINIKKSELLNLSKGAGVNSDFIDEVTERVHELIEAIQNTNDTKTEVEGNDFISDEGNDFTFELENRIVELEEDLLEERETSNDLANKVNHYEKKYTKILESLIKYLMPRAEVSTELLNYINSSLEVDSLSIENIKKLTMNAMYNGNSLKNVNVVTKVVDKEVTYVPESTSKLLKNLRR